MIRVSAMMGLPVVGVEDGRLLGQVAGVLFDGTALSAPCLLVQTGSWALGAHALPFNKVSGLGPDAVIAQRSSDMTAVCDDPELSMLVRRDAQPVGATVYTPMGGKLGTVTDAELDADGKIVTLHLEGGAAVSGRDLLSCGQGVAVARDSATIKKVEEKMAAVQAVQKEQPPQNTAGPVVLPQQSGSKQESRGVTFTMPPQSQQGSLRADTHVQ